MAAAAAARSQQQHFVMLVPHGLALCNRHAGGVSLQLKGHELLLVLVALGR